VQCNDPVRPIVSSDRRPDASYSLSQVTKTLELDGGEWPGAIGPPDLSWSNPGQLEITMTTTKLGGRLTNVADGLTIVRIYNAAPPGTFPRPR